MTDARLRISEIFASIQGEGIWTGVPSTFVRVSGCNLRCVWCDTPYASWNPEGPVLPVSNVVTEVVGKGINHVVLTGGEPMLFDPIETLARELKERGHTITIETAGTIHRSLPCDLMSISPKLSHSTPPAESGWQERHESGRLKIDVLTALMRDYEYQLKFVVNPDAGDDLTEIRELLAKLPPVQPDRVLLMPEGREAALIHRRQRALVDVCMAEGWRLAGRMHVDLFGDTRGT